jgi:hypothetical protein
VAHEYGHTEGLAHADHACGGNANGQSSDDSWPAVDRQGRILGWGFDPVRSLAMPFLDLTRDLAHQWVDFMSYCANTDESNAWISTRNWDILVDREAAGSAAFRARPAISLVRGPGLAVTTLTEADGSGGVITSVQPTDGGAQSPDPAGDVQLVVLDANGKPISTTSVTSTVVHSNTPGSKAQLAVSATIPAGKDPRAIQLIRNGQVLASATASAHAPTVKLLAPRRGATAGSALTVKWSASDADKDPLTIAIDEAASPSAKFRMVAAGLTGNSTKIPLSMLTPAKNARIRVRALDGFRQGVAIVTSVRIPPGPPQVSILEPAKTASVPADGMISLAGQAFDANSKLMKGRALTWLVDGRRVASGATAMTSGLKPGIRKISLVAVSGGRRGVATVRLKVTKVTPRLLTAGGPAKLGKSARSVTLTLAASVPSSLKITGGAKTVNATLGRRAQKVRVPVKPSAKTLALVLQLRGGGGSAVESLAIPRG